MSLEKISKHVLYEKLWASRDFELKHLWQRSIFLATFIIALFTVYFTALDSFIISPSERIPDTITTNAVSSEYIESSEYSIAGTSISFNVDNKESIFDRSIVKLISLDLICFFGFMFSVLWICMAKGSKYMYERHENGIGVMQEEKGSFSDDLQKEIDKEQYEVLWNSGDYTYIPRHGALPLSDYDFRILNFNCSKYSSSKINIAIGYIFVLAWVLLSAGNGLFIVGYFFYNLLAVLILELIAAFLLSYKVLSDSYLRRLDFFLMIFKTNKPYSSNNYFSPEDNQARWITTLFNFNRSGKNSYVLRYINRVFIHYLDICDNWLERDILSELIEGMESGHVVSESIVRRMLSHEKLKDLFETSLMHRSDFPAVFCGTWRSRSNKSIVIDPESVKLQLDNGNSDVLNMTLDKFDSAENKICNSNHDATRIFAATDWKRIRAGLHYDLIDSARTMYLISR